MKKASCNACYVIVLNLIIALGFYFGNINSGYSVLSSDVHNIVPMAQKFDNPNLFKSDLYLNTLDNVKYYTPFFVQPLRVIAKFTNYNYLHAINIMGLISHLLFGVLWFFLFFRFTNNFWVSLFISVLIRGLVWLPGFEIWGISDLWTIMPRTIYITLMPIPFLLISGTNYLKFILSAFLVGLIFNFHPITGLGGILIFLAVSILYVFSFGNKNKFNYKIIAFSILAIILGMIPFIVTYFTKTETNVDYDLELYKKAFQKRIPNSFESPFIYLKQWFQLKTLFFLIPLILYFFTSLKNKVEIQKAKILIALTVIIVFIPSISVYLEKAINSLFGLNIRMAFQFIRLQKLAILPAYFAMAFLLLKLKKHKIIFPSLFIGFVLLLSVSKASFFNRIPFLGDDIFRLILPNTLSISKQPIENYKDIDVMMKYIETHTDKDDLFFGPPIIRSATKRSVILDYKGASLIIEGNPKQFIQWYLDRKELESINNEEEEILFLKNKNVNYILSKRLRNVGVELIYQVNELKLYKVK